MNSDYMDDDYATYDYIMSELANDRDDSNDPEYRDDDGYCEHGRYVGGCGVDWMCQWCEDGISAKEVAEIYSARHTREVREKAAIAEKVLNDLLKIRECTGIFAAEMTERSSNINNPESRYGRTGWRF